jgi:hypothetical protein
VVKLFEFLRRPAGSTRAQFRVEWETEVAPRLLAAPSVGERVRRYVQNDPVDGAEIPGMTVADLDGVGELWFDDLAELEAAVSGAGALLDPERTLLLAAEESVQFERGVGRVKFMGLSRRASGFATREDWVRYWIDVHGPLAHGIPEFTRYYRRYVHNYVLPSAVCSGGLEPQFDGIVEESVDSVEAFGRCLREPTYLLQIKPDEERFVDFGRSHMLLLEERVIR